MLNIFNSFFNPSTEILKHSEASGISNESNSIAVTAYNEEENVQLESRINELKQFLVHENSKTYNLIKRIAHNIGSSPLLNRVTFLDEKYDGALPGVHKFIDEMQQILIEEKDTLTNEEKEEINSLINALKFTQEIAILNYLCRFEKNVIGADKALKNLLNDGVKDLNIGNYLILNFSTINHAIKIKIERTEKGLVLKIFNSGDGIKNHIKDSKKSDHYYPKVYEGLSQEEVLNFLEAVYFPESVNVQPNQNTLSTSKFYEITSQRLGNSLDEEKMLNLKIESRHWQGKIGNCVYKSTTLSIKDSVSKNTYHLIRDKSLNNTIKSIENQSEIKQEELSPSFNSSGLITPDSNHYFSHQILQMFIIEFEKILPSIAVKINNYFERPEQKYSHSKENEKLSQENVVKMLILSKIVNLLRIYKHNKEKITKEEFKKIQEKLKVEFNKLPELEVKSFIEDHVSTYPFLIGLASVDLQKEFLLKGNLQISKDFVSEEISGDEEFLRELFKKNPKLAMNIANEKIKDGLSNDIEFMYSLGFTCVEYIEYASETLRENPYFMLLIYMRNPLASKYFGPELNKNENFKVATVHLDKLYCDFTKWLDGAKGLKKPEGDLNDRNYVLELVKQDGRYLSLAYSFRDDKEIVLEAIKNNPCSFTYAGWDVRDDEEVLKFAVEKNMINLFVSYHKFREDYAFMSSIVKSKYTF